MKVLVAAQDPGGRNAIAPVIEALRARGEEVSEDIQRPDMILAGTSAGDSPDKRAIASLPSVPSIAVLDFWSNYWQRFSSLGEKDFAYLPTRVCVMDMIAQEEMLAEGFPADRIVVTGNPHFDRFADAITSDHEDRCRILFVSQPVREAANLPGFTKIGSDEYDALRDVAMCLKALPEEYYLSLRLHPKEPADKYASMLDSRIRRANEETLEDAISVSGLVVGLFSPVLMQAAAAGKKVLSYEPVLFGLDMLVSNRVGVTTRIESPSALQDACIAYASGEWPFHTKPLRSVWPMGATERVVQEVYAVAHTYGIS